MLRNCAVVALVPLLSRSLMGQTSTSGISGSVTDPSGGVVPNARVSAVQDQTGVSYHLNTTAAGVYSFASIRGKPLLGNAKGLLDRIVGGWNLNGMYTFATGEPFTVTSGVRTSNYSHISRADIVGSLPDASVKQAPGVVGPVLFVDNRGFRIPAPGDDGMGRNLFRGPHFWNVLNHANFDSPTGATDGSNQITSSTFGRICCETIAPPSTQNIIQTGEAARVIQFALRFVF
ncbi:MAG: carboxypeptidase-like regulatory domain-containing protein [Candidatus Solibacter sp.]|nr:carboxypeptidase-like regulatory domain-containing protein [Candidatus Solibacter sp.]